MKKIENKLKKLFPEAEILKDVKRGFYFVNPAICDNKKERIIKELHPSINLINTKGADGEHTVFFFNAY